MYIYCAGGVMIIFVKVFVTHGELNNEINASTRVIWRPEACTHLVYACAHVFAHTTLQVEVFPCTHTTCRSSPSCWSGFMCRSASYPVAMRAPLTVAARSRCERHWTAYAHSAVPRLRHQRAAAGTSAVVLPLPPVSALVIISSCCVSSRT